jgi:hypothetical protein
VTAKDVLAEIRAKLDARSPRVRGVKRVEYRGRTFTAGEARHARQLDLLAAVGEVACWSPQVRFPLIVGGWLVGTYVADFLVRTREDRDEVHEVKGSWGRKGGGTQFVNDAWPLKAKLFQALNPDVRLRVFTPAGEEVPPPRLRSAASRAAAAPGAATTAPRRRSRGAP